MDSPLVVTLFGNVNNEMYRFAVALKEQGMQIRLITLNEGALHNPTSLGYQFLDSTSEILNVDLNDVHLMSLSKEFRKIVVHETSACDFAIFTGMTIAFAHFAKSPYAVFVSGSDAIAMTKYRIPMIRVLASTKKFRGLIRYYFPMMLFVFFQRKSLKLSSFWISLPELAIAELTQVRATLKCDSVAQVYFPIVLANQLAQRDYVLNPAIEVMLVARFNGTKNIYASSLDDKGSLIALEGVLHFVQSNPGLISFSFFSKGSIPQECKLLIEEIGIFCKVEQIGELPFHDFLKRVNSVEVIIDSVGPSPIARNSIESLSLGKYVIANFSRDDSLSSIQKSASLNRLIHNATTPVEVTDGLRKYVRDRAQILTLSTKLVPDIKIGFSPQIQGARLKKLIESCLN
jgi:hypothetical protein